MGGVVSLLVPLKSSYLRPFSSSAVDILCWFIRSQCRLFSGFRLWIGRSRHVPSCSVRIVGSLGSVLEAQDVRLDLAALALGASLPLASSGRHD